MEIVHNASELSHYMSIATELNTGHPVLIDKYLEGKEAEVDCICDGETVLIPGVMEQLERAGVHSGDSMAVYPGLTLTTAEVDTITDYAVRIGLALNVRGLMNIQFVIMPDHPLGGASVFVLEVNSRASRTVPFISKVTGVPMVKVAVKVMLGTTLKQQGYETGVYKRQPLVAIKAPVFSMSKLVGVDTHLGPEMKSTGEVMGIDYGFEAALAKTLLAAGLMLPREGGILLSISDRDKPEAVPIIKKLAGIGYRLYATEGTATMLSALGLPVTMTTKKLSEGYPNVLDVIIGGQVQGVINTVTSSGTVMRDGFAIRRTAAERRIPCFTSLDTARAAIDILVRDKHDYHVQPLASYRNRRHA
jgi:carbamoyl-phosphate synthase large subunit